MHMYIYIYTYIYIYICICIYIYIYIYTRTHPAVCVGSVGPETDTARVTKSCKCTGRIAGSVSDAPVPEYGFDDNMY